MKIKFINFGRGGLIEKRPQNLKKYIRKPLILRVYEVVQFFIGLLFLFGIGGIFESPFHAVAIFISGIFLVAGSVLLGMELAQYRIVSTVGAFCVAVLVCFLASNYLFLIIALVIVGLYVAPMYLSKPAVSYYLWVKNPQ